MFQATKYNLVQQGHLSRVWQEQRWAAVDAWEN